MLAVKNITFAYEETEVVKNFSFEVKRGAYLAVVGESGCGKSTLLELIYGLLAPKAGEIYWGETRLLGPDFHLVPGEPFAKYLSQDFDLMPFTTVAENIGKFLPNRYPKAKKERIQELLEVVDMQPFSEVKVKKLSGGQKQRVALARVLAKEPELLLLDEPFSHIDNFRKHPLRRRLFRYLKERKITCLVATHDTTDALSFADRILVMKSGKLVVDQAPQELYQQPKSRYIASFFDEVNERALSEFVPSDTSGKNVLLYPNELKVVDKSPVKVEVLTSYFKQGFFLVEALWNETPILFTHPASLEVGQIVCLEVAEALLQTRVVRQPSLLL